ncbi:hypothetical protein AAMO2058_000230400 [Amorphochlora amoebiformis]
MPRTVASPGSKETPDGVRPTPSNTGLREKTGIASNSSHRHSISAPAGSIEKTNAFLDLVIGSKQRRRISRISSARSVITAEDKENTLPSNPVIKSPYSAPKKGSLNKSSPYSRPRLESLSESKEHSISQASGTSPYRSQRSFNRTVSPISTPNTPERLHESRSPFGKPRLQSVEEGKVANTAALSNPSSPFDRADPLAKTLPKSKRAVDPFAKTLLLAKSGKGLQTPQLVRNADGENWSFDLVDGPVRLMWRRGNEIGGGANGKVYRYLSSTGEVIAVKRVYLKMDDLEQKKKMIEQLENEVSLMKRLDHPNVVRYYGFKKDPTRFNIIMEFVANSLRNVIREFRGGLTESITRRYTWQILSALAYCHKQGIIHRDIKSHNILVSEKGVVKLCDFGSAKDAGDDAHNNNFASVNYNYTPLYVAPEVVVLSEAKYNAKVDIWSLGCTVIEMASGKAPWSEDSPKSSIQMIGKLVSGRTPALPQKNLTEGARDFIRRCLQT